MLGRMPADRGLRLTKVQLFIPRLSKRVEGSAFRTSEDQVTLYWIRSLPKEVTEVCDLGAANRTPRTPH